jgi:hypothetical protein
MACLTPTSPQPDSMPRAPTPWHRYRTVKPKLTASQRVTQQHRPWWLCGATTDRRLRNSKYPGPPVPGEWQATPSCPIVNGIAVGILFQWQYVTPFGISSASDFLLGPPPALTSNKYCENLQRGNDGRERRQYTTAARSRQSCALLRGHLVNSGVRSGCQAGLSGTGPLSVRKCSCSSPDQYGEQ